MTISWNYGLVAVSVITAIIGSFIALDFAERLRLSRGRERILWTLLGASTMGLAIWSMHFVGMLAMSMGMPMTYDPFLSLLSIVAAAVGSGIAFLILQRTSIGAVQYVFGSLAMGLAISSMHYIGMASMQMAAKIVYDPLLFVASIIIAITASAGALWLVFNPVRGGTALQKIGGALVMGIAISGMHYTGMAAARYIHTGVFTEEATRPMVGPFFLSDLLTAAVVLFGIALIVLCAYAIAERQKAFEALQASERRFLATFEQAAVGIGHVSANGEFIRLNHKYCDILGHDCEALLGRTFQEITHPDDVSADEELYSQLKSGDIPHYTIEKRYIRKDGSIVWVNLTVSIVRDETGDFEYAIAVVEDITEKKRVEEALAVYAAKLEQSNKDLEQFATITSHDLQAPLRKVIMFSENLKMSEGERLSPEGRDCIERVQKASRRMQDLINDLLMLSRVNRKGLPFESTRLATVVDAAIEDLEVLIEESGAKVEVSGEFPKIEVDAGQMQQVFTNLLSNAVKFVPEGRAPRIRVISEVDGTWCRITVQDNGIGFQPEYAQRIFGIFERLHSESQYPGTGVGLAIVQKIIDRHHGTIEAVGDPNQGATFTLTLPLKQSEVKEVPAPSQVRAVN